VSVAGNQPQTHNFNLSGLEIHERTRTPWAMMLPQMISNSMVPIPLILLIFLALLSLLAHQNLLSLAILLTRLTLQTLLTPLTLITEFTGVIGFNGSVANGLILHPVRLLSCENY
jgi:hypothetical protein